MSSFRNGLSASGTVSVGVLFLLAVAMAAGCSSSQSPGNQEETTFHTLPGGESIPGWLVLPSGGQHAAAATTDYIETSNLNSCGECHGSNLAGGVSKVSCYENPAGCHHGPVPNWASVNVHGAAAKRAPGSSGFRACQICHGRDFAGGGSGVDCFTCHTVSAPHAQRPWRSVGGVTHTNTDESNAPVCAECHSAGSPLNPPGHPFEPAVAGSPPGCYNNTMCHGFFQQTPSLGGPAAAR
jgi:hypothetical protein